VRSYQRLFRPERRIYSIDGRSLPVPGGVPLRWLGYLAAGLVSAVVVSSQPGAAAVAVAVVIGVAATRWGASRARVVLAAAASLALVLLAGWLLAGVDWPLRLVIVPGLVATLGVQATPDGRRAHRFAWSWLARRVGGEVRSSLGRRVCGVGEVGGFRPVVRVWPDERCPVLRRARLHGPAVVVCRDGLAIGPRRRWSRTRRARAAGRVRRGWVVARAFTLADGEVVEVRR
jgi:hypothetical protein